MSTRSITVDGVSKRYVKYEDTPTLVGRALSLGGRSRRSELWALNDVDLAVEGGECLGVIGRNGCGKSTLLRLMAGVTAPTTGRVTVVGQVAPLISVGVGFHHELTGRENVFLSGMILGLSHDQIQSRFDEIVEFAEVPGFIDTPVKFYSSGMYVRLGFAVSVLAEPEVLLVDEVLAVGDLAFQMKCFDRMQAIRESGTTIVIVSHNLNAVRLLCDRTVLLDRGSVRHDGDTGEAIALFHEVLGEARELDGLDRPDDGTFHGTGAARFTPLALVSAESGVASVLTAGTVARFRSTVEVSLDVREPMLAFAVFHESGTQVYQEITDIGFDLEGGTSFDVEIGLPVELPRGSYSTEISIIGRDLSVHAAPPPSLLFYVDGRNRVKGVADLKAEFVVHRPS